MDLICHNCGKHFSHKRHKQTCSPECAKARQARSIDEIRSGKGDLFERWKSRTEAGVGYKKARKRKREGR